MVAADIRKAVIYCRVASTLAGTRSEAIASREARCREYAQREHYEIVRVFYDVGAGTTARRSGMDEMLAFLGKQRPERYVVIIDDISTLARSVEVFVQLRAALRDTGAVLESPAFAFEQSREGVLAEAMLASVTQYREERDENIEAENSPRQNPRLSKPHERKL